MRKTQLDYNLFYVSPSELAAQDTSLQNHLIPPLPKAKKAISDLPTKVPSAPGTPISPLFPTGPGAPMNP